ncbi:hypothetical protein ACFFTM_11725 [Pseudoduganella plicata]|uniref:Uncharacterized protein n=1 Tax=Pseudoduganella plicata TaxID=321984 RepID=A0ABX5S6E6_9BURK|nr:hypothetical protein [Pseudoduganella plicata]QBQ35903.1 hypothetical protein E1742_06855 [Pseudoduganella plicata]
MTKPPMSGFFVVRIRRIVLPPQWNKFLRLRSIHGWYVADCEQYSRMNRMRTMSRMSAAHRRCASGGAHRRRHPDAARTDFRHGHGHGPWRTPRLESDYVFADRTR